MSAAHSRVGASSRKRWKNCPGSVALSVGLPNPTSKYAAEGTAAHDLAERCLRKGKPAADFLGTEIKVKGTDFTFTVDEEMAGAVQVYLDAIAAERAAQPTQLLIEHKFHLTELHDALFGTADAVLWQADSRKLSVYDYKHGAGVPVEAVDNEQAQYYAVGALLESGFPAESVEVVIVQPRCPHPDGPVRRWEVDAMEILDWAADVKAEVEATEAEDAPLVPGDHCRWCLAGGAGKCQALRDKALELAQTEFKPDLPYDAELLAETLEWLPMLKAWAKSVEEFALGEAEHGRCPPRYKLVGKRATRKWKDEVSAIEWLEGYGMDAEDIFEKKMKTPAKIEKVLGKANAGDLAELITSESSGNVLAPESDKRPAIKADAADDFSAA